MVVSVRAFCLGWSGQPDAVIKFCRHNSAARMPLEDHGQRARVRRCHFHGYDRSQLFFPLCTDAITDLHPPRTAPSMAEPLPLDVDADDQKLLAQVIDYYHATLKNSTEALDYLKKRGITNSEVITQFKLGYADRTLGKLLPIKANSRPAPATILHRLEQSGPDRASGHEHFAGCITFPTFAGDGTSRIVDLYGKKTLGTKLRKGTPMDMFLTSERHGVWNVQAMTASPEMVLCPSVFDALTFWSHGYRNVSCTFGHDAFYPRPSHCLHRVQDQAGILAYWKRCAEAP